MDKKSIIASAKKCLKQPQELEQLLQTLNKFMLPTAKSCIEACTCEDSNNVKIEDLEIESLLDFLKDELNTGHWSKVAISTRRAFTITSYLKCLITLFNSEIITEDILKKCLEYVDGGLLLGAPLEENPDLLTDLGAFLSKITSKPEDLDLQKDSASLNEISQFQNLKGIDVDRLNCPSLETFYKNYFQSQIPVKLLDCMNHWPALVKWKDLNYLLNIAGNRTVPVEIGSHYTDEDWTQKLMKFGDFFKEHFLGNSSSIGYLAQHNLFDQIPELKRDIYVPEYCNLGRSEDYPDINAWLGPAGTVSPLHYDPKSNFLTQVFGQKEIVLFSPKDTDYLYPHEGNLLSNTSQVNPITPDIEKYPDFEKANPYKCLLKPGEMLFIPEKWWHHVKAIEKSFSVSFWWE